MKPMKRRTALGVIGSAAAAPCLMAMGDAPPAARALDVANPDDVLTIYRKLAHTMDDSVTYWWLRTTRYGLVDSAFTHMWDVHVGAMLTAETVDDNGSYETTTISVVFYTDPQTGAFMETFKNPYTGEEVEIGYFPPNPGKRLFTADGTPEERDAPPGFTMESESPLGPAWIEGGDVWVQGDDWFRMEPEQGSVGRPFSVNDWSTYHGALADVADLGVKNAPATWTFRDFNNWPPWLGMEDRPGNYVSRGHGRKVFSLADMPDTWRRLMADRHPDIYSDPAGALAG